MNWKKLVMFFVLVDFSVLTILALWHQGMQGLLQVATGSWMGATLAADLCIALVLTSIVVYRDARQHGRSPWPYLLLTLCTGSVGTLLYLLLRDSPDEQAIPSLA